MCAALVFCAHPAHAEPLGLTLYRVHNYREFPATGPTVIAWTPKVERDVRYVDRAVNRTMRIRREAPNRDVWQADVAAGDCEDFALTKRRRLIRKGSWWYIIGQSVFWPAGVVWFFWALVVSGRK